MNTLSPEWVFKICRYYNPQTAFDDSIILNCAGGQQGFDFTVTPDSIAANKPRSEFSCQLLEDFGSERAYESRIIIPDDWVSQDIDVHVMQWKYDNIVSAAPSVAISIEGNDWIIRWSDINDINTSNGRPIFKELWRGPMAIGSTTKWRLEAKWHWNSNGFFRAYKDDVLVLDHHAPVAHPDGNYAVFWKFGCYSPAMTRGIFQLRHEDTERFTSIGR